MELLGKQTILDVMMPRSCRGSEHGNRTIMVKIPKDHRVGKIMGFLSEIRWGPKKMRAKVDYANKRCFITEVVDHAAKFNSAEFFPDGISEEYMDLLQPEVAKAVRPVTPRNRDKSPRFRGSRVATSSTSADIPGPPGLSQQKAVFQPSTIDGEARLASSNNKVTTRDPWVIKEVWLMFYLYQYPPTGGFLVVFQ